MSHIKNKKILILGATGMLGHMVYLNLLAKKEFVIETLTYRTNINDDTIICDVYDLEKLERILMNSKPDYVINCIGILIQECNNDPKNGIYINAYFPHWLNAKSIQYNFKLIHISTDCVFSGKKGGYYEFDFRDADDIYGRSKALGEIINERNITLRTSIIGPELKDGTGLFHWFSKQSNAKGFTKTYWGGVTTLQLSKVISWIIENQATGLFNVTNGIKIDKYSLLSIINDTFKFNVDLHETTGKDIDKSLKTHHDNLAIPSYQAMIKDLLEFMLENKEFYSRTNYLDKVIR